jgi:hypothetical protein
MSTAQSVAPPRTTSGTTSLTSHRAITNKARLAGSADRASRDGPLTPVTDTNQAGPIYTTSRDSLVVDIRSSGSLCKNDQAAGEGCVKRVPRTSEPRDVGSGRRLPLAVEAPARYVHVRRRVIPCEAAAPESPVDPACRKGSVSQAAPAYFSRSAKVNCPVVDAIGGAGFQPGSRYRYEFGSR